MASNNLIPRILSSMFVAASLASCTYSDPGYKELLAVADPHPSRNAIVGMWTRSYPGSLTIDKHSISEMYRADGTGLWSYRTAPHPLSFLAPDNAKKLTWAADANGGWKVTHGGGLSASCRISHGRLLQERTIIGGKVHWILDPVTGD